MFPEPTSSDASFCSTVSKNVSLSPWVNERFPGWDQLLSAHDVARLTRRSRWVLLGMMVLGRFPRKRRFHGRRIGWLRSDVLAWVTEDVDPVTCRTPGSPRVAYFSRRQMSLPLVCQSACAARKRRGTCSIHRRVRG